MKKIFKIKNDLIEAINPVITHKDGTQVYTEGCLSVPGFSEDVTRAQHIVIEYFDRDGNKNYGSWRFLAVAWQHEMEHLAWSFIYWKSINNQKKKFEKEWKKDKR